MWRDAVGRLHDSSVWRYAVVTHGEVHGIHAIVFNIAENRPKIK